MTAIPENLFSDDMRRNPYPMYDQMRAHSPLFYVPPPFDGWLIFDYESVKWALSDHQTFSSRVPAPRHWFIFFDPPPHTKLRGLISRETACGVGSTLSTWPLRRASPIKRTSPACSHRPTACSTRGGQRRRHGIS